MDDPDVFFVQYNMFNNYYLALRNQTVVYVQSLQNILNQEFTLFLTILLVAAASLFLAYLFFKI